MKTKFFTLLVLVLAFSLGTVKAAVADPYVVSTFGATGSIAYAATWSSIKTIITDPDNSSNSILKLDRLVTENVYEGVQWTGLAFQPGTTVATQHHYLVLKAKKATTNPIQIAIGLANKFRTKS